MDKPTLRIEILEDFSRRSAADRKRWSEAIAHRMLALPELGSDPGPLMLFLSMEDELDTDPLVTGALAAGFEIYAPRTLPRARRMIPTRVTSLDAVRRGAYGIREPASTETIEPEALGCVVVPAVAYDRRGRRLGRGGGFYDRFLERLAPTATTCGVVFGCHLVDEVPTEPHDRSVHLVVTEGETLRV